MESAYSPNTATDATLDAISRHTRNVAADVVALYHAIRKAKENGYSYNELEAVTGLARGTLQNIVLGKNPRFSVE